MEVKGLELAHWARFHCGKSTEETTGGYQTGEADLVNLLGQNLPPWQMVGKEATACTDPITSCRNDMDTSG